MSSTLVHAPSRAFPPDDRRLRHYGWTLPCSVSMHAAVLLFWWLASVYQSCQIVRVRPADMGGEGADRRNGNSGAGGSEVDFSVQGERAEHIGRPPPTAGAVAAATEPTVQPPPPPAENPIDVPAPPRVEHPRRAPVPSRPTPAVTSTAANAHRAASPQPPSNAHEVPIGGGTSAPRDESGLRPGSVGQQRALLPRAVACNDPVTGNWRSLKYDPLYGDWMQATLHIEREGDEGLHGRILSHQWDGGPMWARPPPCGPVGFDFVVEMPASGSVSGNRVDFGASTWRLREMRCNPELRVITYRPDHFTGIIDHRLQEFQSVNNDGGRAVNDPMVFRRVSCLPGDEVRPPGEPAPARSANSPAPSAAPDVQPPSPP